MKFHILLAIFIFGCAEKSSQKSKPDHHPSTNYSAKVSREDTRQSVIKGANLEMPPQQIGHGEIGDLKDMNIEWVSLIPYAFSRPGETFVRFGSGQWWGETEEGTIECIKMAKAAGMKVMLKPHVWVGGGQGWLGDFDLGIDEKWTAWEKEFSNYILTYAVIAESLDVELLCIGTEVRKSAAKRPQFWRQLIKDVRAVYNGKVTYAANWDNYMNITFWKDLDYIGIDAYFPFSDAAHPIREELVHGWGKITPKLRKLSESNGIQILFTEYGYKSIEYANRGHWKYKEDTIKTSQSTQAIAYQALYESIWQEDFVAGGFFWKWHFEQMLERRDLSRRYTPQGKEAEEVIRKWYGK